MERFYVNGELASPPRPRIAERRSTPKDDKGVSHAEVVLRQRAEGEMDDQTAGFKEWLEEAGQVTFEALLAALWAEERPSNETAREGQVRAFERLRDAWVSYRLTTYSGADWHAAKHDRDDGLST